MILFFTLIMSYQIKKTFVKKETYHIFFSIIISLLFSIIIVIILKGCLNKRNTEGESISKNNKSDDNCVNVELKSEATPEVKEKRESNHRVSIEPGMETIPEEDSEEENLKVGVTETKEEGLLNDKEITNSSLSVDLDSSKDDEYDDFFSESVISKELSCSEISPSKEVKFSPLITSTPNKEEDSK